MSVRYTFKYRKDGVEQSSEHTFASDPSFDEIETQMDSYEPDEKLDYIREDN